jgi:hypothetical protein
MEYMIGIFVVFSIFVVYYLYEIIKHLIYLQKLQLKTNELLYEMNSKLLSLTNK